MAKIALDVPIPNPQAVVVPRLLTVLSGYAQRADVVLSADLGLAGAEIGVPVTVDVGTARTSEAVPVALRATRRRGWFPVFHGHVRSVAGGPLESVLRLDGTYKTPLEPLGGLADRTLLGHAAERSLRAFLERLRADVLTEIQRAELDVRRHETSHG